MDKQDELSAMALAFAKRDKDNRHESAKDGRRDLDADIKLCRLAREELRDAQRGGDAYTFLHPGSVLATLFHEAPIGWAHAAHRALTAEAEVEKLKSALNGTLEAIEYLRAYTAAEHPWIDRVVTEATAALEANADRTLLERLKALEKVAEVAREALEVSPEWGADEERLAKLAQALARLEEVEKTWRGLGRSMAKPSGTSSGRKLSGITART